jgi:L-ascorbate metabolism protein UlaG (beta-lactamase superfamily)
VITTVLGEKRLGGTARGLEPWGTTLLDAPTRPAIEITATPCRHGPPLSRPLIGDVVGFALRWDGHDDGALWISGDTVLYDGVREVSSRLKVHTALLHLGGVRFPVTGPLRYTMTARDAVELCRLVRPRTVIPIHYEGWKHFQQDRDAIEREFAGAPPDIRRSIRWLPIGAATEVRA